MTPAELNVKAARLCGRDPVRHGRAFHDFSPCTSPADCNIVMEAMKAKGWRLADLEDTDPRDLKYEQREEEAGWRATWQSKNGRRVTAVGCPSAWHAVTLAAVRAVS
jgi:hypothetical protein